MGWLEECRGFTGVPLSSKATLVPSELPSQLIKTWLQSSALMRGVLEWTLRSMSSSKLHWLDLPLRPETNPTLAESCSFRNSEPSTRRLLGTGLEGGEVERGSERLLGKWFGRWQDKCHTTQHNLKSGLYCIYFNKAKTNNVVVLLLILSDFQTQAVALHTISTNDKTNIVRANATKLLHFWMIN